jgi:hypothetical protein
VAGLSPRGSLVALGMLLGMVEMAEAEAEAAGLAELVEATGLAELVEATELAELVEAAGLAELVGVVVAGLVTLVKLDQMAGPLVKAAAPLVQVKLLAATLELVDLLQVLEAIEQGLVQLEQQGQGELVRLVLMASEVPPNLAHLVP